MAKMTKVISMKGRAEPEQLRKLVTGAGEPLLGRLAVIDALAARQHEIAIRPAVTA